MRTTCGLLQKHKCLHENRLLSVQCSIYLHILHVRRRWSRSYVCVGPRKGWIQGQPKWSARHTWAMYWNDRQSRILHYSVQRCRPPRSLDWSPSAALETPIQSQLISSIPYHLWQSSRPSQPAAEASMFRIWVSPLVDNSRKGEYSHKTPQLQTHGWPCSFPPPWESPGLSSQIPSM